MSIYEENELNDSANSSIDIYDGCYEIYKRKYASDDEFSINDNDGDISKEVSILLDCYNAHFKRRKYCHSDSIYSDILDDLVVEVPVSASNREKKKSMGKRNISLDMSLIEKDNNEFDRKDENSDVPKIIEDSNHVFIQKQPSKGNIFDEIGKMYNINPTLSSSNSNNQKNNMDDTSINYDLSMTQSNIGRSKFITEGNNSNNSYIVSLLIYI